MQFFLSSWLGYSSAAEYRAGGERMGSSFARLLGSIDEQPRLLSPQNHLLPAAEIEYSFLQEFSSRLGGGDEMTR